MASFNIPADQRSHAGFIYRLAASINRVTPSEGWTTFIILLITLLVMVGGVERGEWVPDSPDLWAVATFGAVAGLAMAKVKIHALFLHILGLGLGLVFTTWRTLSLIETGSLSEKLSVFIDRLDKWMDAVRSGGINTDFIIFAYVLAIVTWLISYFTAWYTFRQRNPWPGVILVGLAVLTNLSYLPSSYYIWGFLFFFTSMLFLARVNFLKQEETWKKGHVESRPHHGFFALHDAFWFILILVSLSAVLPAHRWTLGTANDLWEKSREPWTSVEQKLGRTFASLPPRKPSPLHDFGATLPLKGSIVLGHQIALRVISAQPGYWRGKSYDVYTSQGWVSSEHLIRPLGEVSAAVVADKPKGTQYTQRISVEFDTDVIFSAGTPIGSVPVTLAEVPAPITYDFNFSSLTSTSLPPSVRAFAAVVQSAQSERSKLTDGDVKELLPESLVLQRVRREGNKITGLRVTTRDVAPDVIALRPVGHPKATYAITSIFPFGSEDQLRAAGTNYPEWVASRHLALPSSVPERVRQLSRDVTKDTKTPYDKAAAIESYLRGFEYTTNIEAPPFGADAVDHFLFTLKRGYSEYFASAMTVMLRSSGVPARIAIGYATGEFDEATQQYIVREKQAHGWVEVYFPGYGWTPFEPTPIYNPIARVAAPEDSGTSGVGSEPDPEFPLEDFNGGEDPNLSTPLSLSKWFDWSNVYLPLLGIFSLMAISFLVFIVYLQRGLGGQPLVAQTYEKMCRLATYSGNKPARNNTPAEFSSRLSAVLPEFSESIGKISSSYTKSRYGRGVINAADEIELKARWQPLQRRLFFMFISAMRPKLPSLSFKKRQPENKK
ncbi:MAG: hypothetical protein EXR59_00355 [Dehalococcoidia bacterium]|nr:hypothetical protein [Dehalococcoidia bacterium]